MFNFIANAFKKLVGKGDQITAPRSEDMSFKEIYDIIGLPVVTFTSNGNKIHFLFDSGSNHSIIDGRLLDSIEHEKLNKETTITGIGGVSEDAYYIRAVIQYKEQPYLGEFQVFKSNSTFDGIQSATGIKIQGILGTDFFDVYNYVLDFKDFIAYSKGFKCKKK